MSTFGALGDIHGDFDAVCRIMERHPDVPFWVCVGDVADAEGHYEAFPSPLYWIKGNNENFDLIAAESFPPGLHYIPNGELIVTGGLRVVGLGGTFAPTMYELAPADLPHPKKATAKATELADRRRHFVRQEVERLKTFAQIDVFLSHEAPVPFRVGRVQAGKRPVNDVVAAVKPRLHLFGHHHRFQESTVEGVPSVCLDLARDSYLLLDRKTLEYRKLKA